MVIAKESLQDINEKWDNHYSHFAQVKHPNKVHFPTKGLVKVHKLMHWTYAYKAARKGPWEQYARDRERFKKRIERVEVVLRPVLLNKIKTFTHAEPRCFECNTLQMYYI